MTDTPTAVTPTTTAVYEDAAERFQRERFELVEQALRDKEAKREEEAGDSNGDSDMDKVAKYARGMHPMLRYCKPYWWPYKTFAKQRCVKRGRGGVIPGAAWCADVPCAGGSGASSSRSSVPSSVIAVSTTTCV